MIASALILAASAASAAGADRTATQTQLASLQARLVAVRPTTISQQMHLDMARRRAELAQRALDRRADTAASRLATQAARHLAYAEGSLTARQEIMNVAKGVQK